MVTPSAMLCVTAILGLELLLSEMCSAAGLVRVVARLSGKHAERETRWHFSANVTTMMLVAAINSRPLFPYVATRIDTRHAKLSWGFEEKAVRIFAGRQERRTVSSPDTQSESTGAALNKERCEVDAKEGRAEGSARDRGVRKRGGKRNGPSLRACRLTPVRPR